MKHKKLCVSHLQARQRELKEAGEAGLKGLISVLMDKSMLQNCLLSKQKGVSVPEYNEASAARRARDLLDFKLEKDPKVILYF